VCLVARVKGERAILPHCSKTMTVPGGEKGKTSCAVKKRNVDSYATVVRETGQSRVKQTNSASEGQTDVAMCDGGPSRKETKRMMTERTLNELPPDCRKANSCCL